VTTYVNNLNGAYNGDGMFYLNDAHRVLTIGQITDGLSNTFMIGEDSAAVNAHAGLWWSNFADNNACFPPNVAISNPRLNPTTGQPFDRYDFSNLQGFRSYHPGGLQFAFADGSVHFVGETISMTVYRAMATISGGEVASLP
jgi:prepilin-type processing-associated H-X9-DG protein